MVHVWSLSFHFTVVKFWSISRELSGCPRYYADCFYIYCLPQYIGLFCAFSRFCCGPFWETISTFSVQPTVFPRGDASRCSSQRFQGVEIARLGHLGKDQNSFKHRWKNQSKIIQRISKNQSKIDIKNDAETKHLRISICINFWSILEPSWPSKTVPKSIKNGIIKSILK